MSKITVRPYQSDDYSMVLSWWNAAGEVPPLPGMMPLDSSFIAEIDDMPALAVALYLTNTPEICWVENFVGNPELKGESRRQATVMLLDHLIGTARRLGFKRLMCMSEKEVLKKRYQEIGFYPTLSGVTTFARSI